MDGTFDLTLLGKQTQAKCIEQDILCYKEQNYYFFYIWSLTFGKVSFLSSGAACPFCKAKEPSIH